jgi:hypothetical protein
MAKDEHGAEIIEKVAPTSPEAVVASKTEPVISDLASQAVAIAEAAVEKLAKAEKDRDSYKEGMLAKDRKLKELKDQGVEIGDTEKITLADIDKILEEKLAQRKPAEVSDLTKQVSELKTALVNRQGLPATPAGGSAEETPAPKATRWVDEPAVAERLKSQGLDPNKVYENWKANQPN